MSHGLAPSKSTVYISNLPYKLKNNDLHKLFEKYGRIIKVTIVKDRRTRKSKGVAFVLYLNKADAAKCVAELNNQELFGRMVKASIAKDNGRSVEFIRRKNYPDKSQCFECGKVGHLSYKCIENVLGERQPPPKKVRKRKKQNPTEKDLNEEHVSSDDEYKKMTEEDCETLSAAIALEQQKHELEDYRYKVATGMYDNQEQTNELKKKIKKSSYFSDEEESD